MDSSVLESAWAADWVAVVVGVAALIAVAVGWVFRPGGLRGRFVMDVFSGFATLGTFLKLPGWFVETLSKSSAAQGAPGGTDLVLLAGALLAGAIASTESTWDAVKGRPGETSLATDWRNRVAAWLRPQPDQLSAEETPEAAEERKRSTERERER